MTPLVRTDLRAALQAANDHPHPGLLLQRGWTDYEKADGQGAASKTRHLQRIAALTPPPHYKHALLRWLAATRNPARFAHLTLKIEGRLLIGLAGGGALETGCAVSQTYGMPTLPGSSIKGVVRAHAGKRLEAAVAQQLFGAEASSSNPAGLSGLLTFHDAWWLPGNGKPFVEEIVTPHHSGYYSHDGETQPTDLDSPIPNAMIGVQGAFLITLEGPAAWLAIACLLTQQALAHLGIGAKTHAGYGVLTPDDELLPPLLREIDARHAAQNFARAKLHRNPGTGEIKATLAGNKTTAPVRGPAAEKLLAALPEAQRNGKKIKDGKLDVEVRVKMDFNKLELLELRAVQE